MRSQTITTTLAGTSPIVVRNRVEQKRIGAAFIGATEISMGEHEEKGKVIS